MTLSPRDELPGSPSRLEEKENFSRAYRERSRVQLRYRTISYPRRTNINALPYRLRQLRVVLGLPNPRPIDVVGELLLFRRLGFQPNFAATIGRILITTRSIPAYTDTSAHAVRLSTLYLSISMVSVVNLLPSILDALTLEGSAVTR